MLRADLEEAVIALFQDGLGSAYALDEASNAFRAVGRKVWVEPRIESVTPRSSRSEPGQEDDTMRLRVRCFVHQGRKGTQDRPLLSRVVDSVRALVDTTLGASAYRVTTLQEDGNPFVVGHIQWSPAREVRQYGVAISVGGDSVPDVDVATLTVDAHVRAGSCG